MSSESDGWNEYKKLVINELERNDHNIKEVLRCVQEVSSKVTSIETNIHIFKEEIEKQAKNDKELEKKVYNNEKEMASLKTKVMMIGGAIGAGASIIVTAILKALL